MPAKHEHARITRSAVVTLACLAASLVIISYFQRYGLSTLAADRASIRAWLAGDGLYAYRSPGAHLGTTLPPFAALLLAPAALLPLTVTGWLLALTGVAALILSATALAGPVARRYGKARGPAVLLAVGLSLLVAPVRATIGLGSLDLVLFGLITADVVALRRRSWARSRAAWWPGRPACEPQRSRTPAHLIRRAWATGAWAGVGVGVATALAVSPVLFIAYLMVSRQWRAALTAVATTASLLAGSVLISPGATAAWLGSVLSLDRSGRLDTPTNQSLAGVLARLYDSSTTPVLIWLSFAGLLLAVGMIRARSAHADGDEIAAFTLIGLTAAAACPTSRVHELIWILPAVLILLDAAARRRVTTQRAPRRRLPGAAPAGAAILTYLLYAVAVTWMTVWNGYAFAVILLLNTLPWRPGAAPALPARRRPQPIRRAPAIPGPRGS